MTLYFSGGCLAQRTQGKTEAAAQTEGNEEGIGPRVRKTESKEREPERLPPPHPKDFFLLTFLFSL